MADPEAPRRPPLSGPFFAIIVFKCLKAAGFLLLGAVVLHIAHLSRRDPTMELAEMLGVNAHRLGVEQLQSFYEQFTPGQVQALGLAAISIGLVFAAEGTFLAARFWWATYLTVLLTALGLPVELREIARKPAHARGYVLFAVNLAILVYVWMRRNEFRPKPAIENRPPGGASP